MTLFEGNLLYCTLQHKISVQSVTILLINRARLLDFDGFSTYFEALKYELRLNNA